MFVGGLQADVRSIVAALSKEWKGRPIYVGCSGNFTFERILAVTIGARCHSNDVSLYSCAIGGMLIGVPVSMHVKDESYSWLEPYLDTPVRSLASIMLLQNMLSSGRGVYRDRMLAAYCREWDRLHAETCSRIEKRLQGWGIASFWAGDVLEHLRKTPENAVLVSAPPTYRGGYERLYKALGQIIEWDEPSFRTFDEQAMAELIGMLEGRDYCIICDHELTGLRLHAVAQASLGKRPCYVYANAQGARLSLPRTKTGIVPPPIGDADIDSLSLAIITQPQMSTLRAEYVPQRITPARAGVCLALLSSGKVLGAIGYDTQRIPNRGDAYMMVDFAVLSKRHKKLSKLILLASLSVECQALVQQALNKAVRTIGTTAFTDKPISMKYRGIYELKDRREGRLNYVARAGQWTLAEALETWRQKYADG